MSIIVWFGARGSDATRRLLLEQKEADNITWCVADAPKSLARRAEDGTLANVESLSLSLGALQGDEVEFRSKFPASSRFYGDLASLIGKVYAVDDFCGSCVIKRRVDEYIQFQRAIVASAWLCHGRDRRMAENLLSLQARYSAKHLVLIVDVRHTDILYHLLYLQHTRRAGSFPSVRFINAAGDPRLMNYYLFPSGCFDENHMPYPGMVMDARHTSLLMKHALSLPDLPQTASALQYFMVGYEDIEASWVKQKQNLIGHFNSAAKKPRARGAGGALRQKLGECMSNLPAAMPAVDHNLNTQPLYSYYQRAMVYAKPLGFLAAAAATGWWFW